MITVLSLGAGVQSSTLALMAAHGEVTPMPDCAIFADTQAEPKAVYEWLDWLETQLPFPVHRITKGSLMIEQLTTNTYETSPTGRGASLPYFSDNSGRAGMLQRQCTKEYKIEPQERFLRRNLLGLAPRQRAPKIHTVDHWYGISLDEIQRCQIEFVMPWKRNVYPLVEKRMTRGHCIEWMVAKGYPVPPRSSCLVCPFHSDAEWARIKDTPEWAQVVEFDKTIRHNGRKDKPGGLYLHRELKPIDEVDFTTPESAGQMSMLDECGGVCGV